jgi:hypothetical protein
VTQQNLCVFAYVDPQWVPCGPVREWKVRFEEYEVPVDQIQKISSAFRHIDDVSTPAAAQAHPLSAENRTAADRITKLHATISGAKSRGRE